MFTLGNVCVSTEGYRPWYQGYLPRMRGGGVPTLVRGYLPWMESTYPGQGLPTLARGYLPWRGDTYPGWGVPTLDGGGGGYLPWTAGGYASCGFPQDDFLVLYGTTLGLLPCSHMPTPN